MLGFGAAPVPGAAPPARAFTEIGAFVGIGRARTARPARHWFAPWVALGLAWVVTGCAAAPVAPRLAVTDRPVAAGVSAGPACPAGTRRMLVAELFFGRSIGGGPRPRQVRAVDWDRFAADTLARAFPDGFTVRAATGAWRNPASGQMVTEATQDVVVALGDRPAAVARVRWAIGVYRRRFHQQSVGLLVGRACGAF